MAYEVLEGLVEELVVKPWEEEEGERKQIESIVATMS